MTEGCWLRRKAFNISVNAACTANSTFLRLSVIPFFSLIQERQRQTLRETDRNWQTVSHTDRQRETDRQTEYVQTEYVTNLVFYVQSTSTVISGQRERQTDTRETDRQRQTGRQRQREQYANTLCFIRSGNTAFPSPLHSAST